MHPQLAPGAFNADDCARDLVRDLHEPKPRLFWMDLVLTAIIGWSAFSAAAGLDSYWSIFALVAMSLAMYRGLCVIHELTHIRARTLPGFETAWNLLFGVPLLLPSFVFCRSASGPSQIIYIWYFTGSGIHAVCEVEPDGDLLCGA